MTVLDRTGHAAPVLADCSVARSERAPLAVRIAARHLCALGATARNDLERQARPADLFLTPQGNDVLRCSVAAWNGAPLDDEPDVEPIVQAISGLMAVHGRDAGRPRRLGLDVASTAAGILAATGALASLIARARGSARVHAIETSVLHGALTYLGHHLAIGTCGKRLPVACDPPIATTDALSPPAPPFPTADGHRVEIEVLSVEAWRAFWSRIGVDAAQADAAWSAFALRYLAGTCRLPAPFALATSRCSEGELVDAARASGVSIARVRGYDELLIEVGGSRAGRLDELDSPWTIRPSASNSSSHSGPRSHDDAPLSGLRVIEATTRLQGPLATGLLRMLGAEVIRIEPVGGDIGRTAPGGAFRAAYSAYNHGKEVVELDYKEPRGRADLLDLISTADVFLHNWPAARAERLGLDSSVLGAVNPSLVYTHASGWGPNHRDKGPITGDFLVQAHAACGEGLHPAVEPPLPSRVTIVDVIGGLIACEGTLAALYHREITSAGAAVETSLLAAALTLQSPVLRDMLAGRESGRVRGRPAGSVFFHPIETGDGYLYVSADGADNKRRVTDLCNLPSDDEDPDAVSSRLRCRSAVEWERALQSAGLRAATVRTDLGTIACDPRTASAIERAEPGILVPARPWEVIS